MKRAGFFGSVLALLVTSLGTNVVLSRHLQSGFDLAGHFVFGALALVGLLARNDYIHKIIAPLLLIADSFYIVLLFVTLPS